MKNHMKNDSDKIKHIQDKSSLPVVKKNGTYEPTNKNRIIVLRRLITLSYPELLRITMGISALIVNSLTNLSFPWIMGQAIDRATSGHTGSTATSVLDTSSIQGLITSIVGRMKISPEYLWFLGKATGVFMCGSIASWVRVYCLGTSTDTISLRLRRRLFEGYMDKKVEFFDTAKAGEMVTVIEKDTVTAAQTLTDKLANGVRAINSCLNGSVMLFNISPKLCAVSLGIVPFVGVGAMMIHKQAKKLSDKLRKFESETLSYVMERLDNISTVRLNGQENFEKEKFALATERCYDYAAGNYYAQGSLLSFIGLATNISLMSILFIGGGMLGKKEMSAGTLTRFAIQSAFVGLGFSGLSTFYSDMLKSVDAAGRVFHQIDTNQSEISVAAATANDATTANDETSTVLRKGDIARASFTTPDSNTVTLNDVSFAYAIRKDKPVMSHLSLEIASNSLTCIVGKSGVGKSTLLGLISGLLVPCAVENDPLNGSFSPDKPYNGGNILIGGVDIRSIDNDTLRSIIGVVEQGGAGLLSGTIYDNISYGYNSKNSKPLTPEQMRIRVEHAAQDASAHEFISSLPDGYETHIGEGGKMLSGGQRARIVLARALVKQPLVLLLDEATAALDTANELEILEVLNRLKQQNHTIISFTHSENMMKIADTIHVVELMDADDVGESTDRGRSNSNLGCHIVDSGTFECLIGSPVKDNESLSTYPHTSANNTGTRQRTNSITSNINNTTCEWNNSSSNLASAWTEDVVEVADNDTVIVEGGGVLSRTTSAPPTSSSTAAAAAFKAKKSPLAKHLHYFREGNI